MDAVEALTRLGGIARRKHLRALITRTTLERACEAGEVVRVGPGLYAAPGVDEARAAARRLHGVVSHLSAARAHGWKVKRSPRQPMVTVPRHSARRDPRGARLFYADLTSAERSSGKTAPVRTVVDCARALPYDEALSVADSALRSGKVTRAELQAAAVAGPRTGRARARRVAASATPKAANPFESVLRAIAETVPGLTVEPQGPVASIGHADLTDASLRIAIEADSFEFHALREAFDYDVRRYTAMVRAGWLVARFTWDEVMHRPAYVRAVLADLVVLRHGGQEVRRRSS